jgi:hypothetical protein
MTEEEAKTKACCGPSYCGKIVDRWREMNRNDESYLRTNRVCIASACMAWRWEWEKGDMNDQAPEQWRVSTTIGYCGVAGRP